VVAAGLVAAITAAIVLPLTLGGDDKPSGSAGPAPGTSPTSRSSYRPPTTTTTPSRFYYTPTVADFTLDIRVTRKACFGSAGCNVDYQIVPSYTGLPLLDPATKVNVIYEVSGDESGPQIGSFTMDSDGQARVRETESASTPSSKTTLKVKVTDVYTSRSG